MRTAWPAKEITGSIVRSAVKVHQALGPGLLESTYRACLLHELRSRDLKVRHEVRIPIEYEGLAIDISYRADLIVEESVLIELKAVERLLPVHEAQILTYLRHCKLHVGFLINFNVYRLMSGLRRYAL